MTPLPQRKKTAEEIAQLRDQLGVPASVEGEEPFSEQPPEQASEQNPAPPADPEPQSAVAQSAEAATRKFSLPPPSYPSQMAAKSSKLPAKRRSPEELEEMRRREMLSQINTEPPTNIKFMAAHPALIALGYLLAAVGSASFWIEAYPWPAVIGASVAALIVAGFIALRRPVSRHHAGFISAISVLTGIFSTIHHFPQLQHAS